MADVGNLKAEEDRIRRAYARRRDDGRYAISDVANLLRIQDIERRLLRLLDQHGALPLRDKHILEIGCGTGYWLREFMKWGADPAAVGGVDLLADRVAAARRLCASGSWLLRSNAACLPFPDAEFDLVAQFTVFTSILDGQLKRRVAQEMVRVLKPRGLVLWYDFQVANPRNPDVQGVGRREIADLFPACSIWLQRVTLAPPIARLAAPLSWRLCTLLDTIPVLRTHYLGLIQKP